LIAVQRVGVEGLAVAAVRGEEGKRRTVGKSVEVGGAFVMRGRQVGVERLLLLLLLIC
jgi:hypothetical protein